MESQKQQKHSSPPSEIAEFYQGKSVFITGATGFVGSVLLESLLRCCPGIRRIYILLRPKKGVQPEDRKENIFKKEIFCEIREKYPDVLNKVVVVTGDVAHDNLGMSLEDLYKVSQEVVIVFHCAAAISFFKPLSFTVHQNLIGTNNVIEFCKQVKKMEVFCYTSTAYSNCNVPTAIEERIYKLPFTAEEAVQTYKTDGEEGIMRLYLKCDPKFPNFYTFSKSVSESLVAEKATDFPSFIVRPSVIICCLKGPLPGYVEDGTALTNLSIGVGKGFIRLLRCDPEKICNHIAADIVGNTHIVGAYRQVVGNLPSPFIYNCVATSSKAWTWGSFITHLSKMVDKYPLPNAFQNPGVTICKSRVKYYILSIFDHYAPAAIIDSLLWLSSRKPRLLKLYRFYDKSMSAINNFMLEEWYFRTENFESLSDNLNATDKELFPVDLDENYNLEYITKIIVTGSPVYQSNNTKPEEKLRPKYVPMYLTSIIKWTLVGSLVSALFMMLF